MMHDIKENVSDWNNTFELNEYLRKIIRKEAHDHSGKLYGLGHAVYTKSDPRAVLLLEQATSLAKQKNRDHCSMATLTSNTSLHIKVIGMHLCKLASSVLFDSIV